MLLVDSAFHPAVAGVLPAAILAAVMSTTDSRLLVSSSALAKDLYKGLLHPYATAEKMAVTGLYFCLPGYRGGQSSHLGGEPSSNVNQLFDRVEAKEWERQVIS